MLAIDLGRRGVRCILLEQKEAPQFLPKMERCNARTMEIYRRLGIAQKIRDAGFPREAPIDVFIVTSLVDPPLLHLHYPSVARAQAEIAAYADGTLPLESCQLISQYTLEPLLKSVAESIPHVDVRYGCEFISFEQDSVSVRARVKTGDGAVVELSAFYLVGCDGGTSAVRRQLGIKLQGEANLLLLRPDLHVIWCGNRLPDDPNELAARATGHWYEQTAKSRNSPCRKSFRLPSPAAPKPASPPSAD